MPRQWEYQLPTPIQFGRGCFRNLGEAARPFGSSAMLVGYKDRTGLDGAYAAAAESLEKAGLSTVTFYEIPPDPDAELVQQGARLAKEAKVDVVIGLGGGSVIDAAKGIAVLARMGGTLWDYTGANEQSKPVTDALPLIAVPTTAGTGTEVSPVAVFTHHGVGPSPDVPLKASVSGPPVRPKLALVDPQLATGSPPELTASCGADALGHAMEACMSRNANPISSTLAGRAVGLIVENLARAVDRPDDPEPREPLALASTLAGAAFGSAGVVVPHAIAQALGGVLHVPHGVGVAIATPLSLRFSADVCVEQYAEMARFCGIVSNSPKDQAAEFVDRIVCLLQSVGLPNQVDVPHDAPHDLLDKLVQNAFDSTPVPIKLNPKKIDRTIMRELFEQILP